MWGHSFIDSLSMVVERLLRAVLGSEDTTTNEKDAALPLFSS